MLRVGKRPWRCGGEYIYVWQAEITGGNNVMMAEFKADANSFAVANGLMFWEGASSVRLSSRNSQGTCLDSDITGFLKNLAREKQVTFVLVRICTDATPGAIMGLRF